jgi:hypothetical protein
MPQVTAKLHFRRPAALISTPFQLAANALFPQARQTPAINKRLRITRALER